MNKHRIITLSIILALVFGATGFCFADTGLRSTDTVWLAHKGYSGKAPANTTVAMVEAVNAGFDGAEMDVWVSRHGMFLSHDKKIHAVGGKKIKVTSLTLANRDKYKVRGRGKYGPQVVPTLDEALNAIWSTADAQGKPGFIVELDIKQNHISAKAVRRIINMVGDRNVRINTSSPRVVKLFKKYRKSSNTQIWIYIGNRSQGVSKRFIKKAKKLGVNGVSMPPSNWKASTIKLAKSKGLQLAAYTNNRGQICRLVHAGFNRICCNSKHFQ